MVTASRSTRSEQSYAQAFGIALGHAIADSPLTQRDLGRAVGKSEQTVSGWVNGAYEPAPRLAMRIEEVLQVPYGTLTRHLGYVSTDADDNYMTVNTPEDAITGDPHLTGAQKRALLLVIEEFRR